MLVVAIHAKTTTIVINLDRAAAFAKHRRYKARSDLFWSEQTGKFLKVLAE
jgi:hypothetical protein